jgi:hypothetical protein
MGGPAVVTLAPTPPAAGAEPQAGTFAVFSRLARLPRVFALPQRERDYLVAALQQAAAKKLGLRVGGEFENTGRRPPLSEPRCRAHSPRPLARVQRASGRCAARALTLQGGGAHLG